MVFDCYFKLLFFYDWLKKVGEDVDVIWDEVGDWGFIVYKFIEMYDEGIEVSLINEEIGKIDYKLVEWLMFEWYVEFWCWFVFDVIYLEFNFISDNFGFVGILDWVIKFNGCNFIIDIKIFNSLYDYYWLQMVVYK